MHTHFSKHLSMLMGVVSLAFLSHASAAQEPQAKKIISETPVFILDEFNVFGRRLPVGAEPSPLYSTEIKGIDLEEQVGLSFADLQRESPAFLGNVNNDQQANGGSGSQGLNLGGLGSSRTILLLNGFRAQTNSAVGVENGGFGNLALIAPSAIEKIGVFRGSSATVFGTDAIAGAVDFQLRSSTAPNLVGVAIEEVPSSGGDTYSAYGFRSFRKGRFSVVAGFSYLEREALPSRERELSASANFLPLGGIDRRSLSFPGRITLGPPETANEQVLNDSVSIPASIADYRNLDVTNDRFDFAETSLVVPENRLLSGMIGFQAEPLKDTIVHSHLVFSQQDFFTELAPAPWSSLTGNLLDAARMSPHLPVTPAENLIGFTYRSFELGNLTNDWQRRAIWGDTKLTKALGPDSSVSIGFSASYVDIENRISGIADAQILEGAIAEGSFNPFGRAFSAGIIPSGALTGQSYENELALREAAVVPTDNYEEAHLALIASGTHNELNIGPFLASGLLGTEFRFEHVRADPDPFWALESNLGGLPVSPFGANRASGALFGELIINALHKETYPLLSVRLNGRLEGAFDSATGGPSSNDANSYVVAVVGVDVAFRPSEKLIFTLGCATGFRSPSLFESFGGTVLDSPPLIDPLGFTPVGTSIPSSVSSNPDLDPERSLSLNAIVDIEPTLIPSLKLSASAYFTRIRDVVSNGAQFILSQNANGQPNEVNVSGDISLAAPFSDRISRDPISGIVLGVDSSFFNASMIETSGLDLLLEYEKEWASHGALRFFTEVKYILNYRIESVSGAEAMDIAGSFVDSRSNRLSPGAVPRWKAAFGAQYQKGPVLLSTRITHIPTLRDDPLFTSSPSGRDIEAYTRFDFRVRLEVSKILSKAPRGTAFSVGLENAFDRQPPFAAGAVENGFDSSTYDIRGRVVSIELGVPF